MWVILRTPAEHVAEYDLPNVDSSSSDEQILAAAAGVEPIRRGDTEIVGEPYVYARGLDALAQQGQRLAQADSRLEAEKDAAREVARKYFDDGYSKADISKALRVTRVTLDSWLGKSARQRGGGE
ncbi:hypothetical protein [Mycolicibacterium fortuitum]|uniref:Uncharacterized protein n=2 Tax=Mycolicibacterium fortuitum TaxID=1766 RepID=A0AAE4VFF6_MYCFO|nr:hypothetical protein [Mycolicibacterium fortuitum]MCV7137892.1 hypothetical protein [Mycolicibacterium fortuitum]MDV7195384.1 hypothetical protein [Mycolicibacterium fortuitum]MDV7209097.1 hypothetical protein [Mycolicibacterium fortuitum]MDV7229218.1 hypothetical protein [Mycolicibacterium fortuitum]MDV7260917.1 hypothetical protein [Mycolicibacterium fortuitum]